MKKNVPDVPAVEGNTKTSTAPALFWCFTHNFDKTLSDYAKDELIVPDIKNKVLELNIEKKLSLICKKYLFSLETGEKGRLHLQGYIKANKKIRFNQVKKLISDSTHWEKCKGSEIDNELYILKNPYYTWKYDKAIEKEFTEEQLNIIKKEKLYDWQLDYIDIVDSKPDKRTIYWPWSCCGKIGKSELINYLLYHNDCGLIGGNRTDIMCNISGKDGKKAIKKCYLMNLEKNVNVNNISYSALEQIKDGLLISTKYESNYRQIPSPHIIVFANAPPNTNKLMPDRWAIRKLCYCVENKPEDYIDDE